LNAATRRSTVAPAMDRTSFSLDPQLARDGVTLGRLALCRALLMNDRRFPWLVLVPERAGAVEIVDLVGADRALLMDEIATASHALVRSFAPDKLNVAALGNRVRQLHVHVVARFASDAAWPNPVWGVGAAEPYPSHALGALAERLALGVAEIG
jgi:diadenosine tetraphosphate (Ap4A) HIT family hydrolase